jgi:hypothetical protein
MCRVQESKIDAELQATGTRQLGLVNFTIQ